MAAQAPYKASFTKPEDSEGSGGLPETPPLRLGRDSDSAGLREHPTVVYQITISFIGSNWKAL